MRIIIIIKRAIQADSSSHINQAGTRIQGDVLDEPIREESVDVR